MNRMLVVLAAVCLPMLSVAAPPITEPVDVNVTNPVLPVEVSNAYPIPVSVADRPERNGFVVETVDGNLRTTVPAGVVWVIENFTLRCDVDATGKMTGVVLTFVSGGEYAETWAFPHYVDANGGESGQPVNQWVASGSTRQYVNPGATVLLTAESDYNATGAIVRNCVGHISGYSVPLAN